MSHESVLQPRRQSTGMRGLRIAVLAADTLSLLAVLIIRVARPLNSGQDGEALFWAGLLLAYALILLFGLTLVVNVVYLIALGFMQGRYENGYGRVSRALLFLIPAATFLGLTLR
ncbi:hypothetical protein [Arthrobacter sp. 92]|uniref:hypothetical protein n=1 Tax=Arthrobacter sp. 92 TaxID=3418175 RepID=UPI003D05CEF8